MLFLPFWRIGIFTCNDLDFRGRYDLVAFHLELWILHNECPDIIT